MQPILIHGNYHRNISLEISTAAGGDQERNRIRGRGKKEEGGGIRADLCVACEVNLRVVCNAVVWVQVVVAICLPRCKLFSHTWRVKALDTKESGGLRGRQLLNESFLGRQLGKI